MSSCDELDMAGALIYIRKCIGSDMAKFHGFKC